MRAKFFAFLVAPSPGRSDRWAQSLAIVTVIATLALAFHIGVVRGFDHTIGTDSWGRMLFGIGGAITDQVFGVKGYVIGRYVQEILTANGLTADPGFLEKLGTSFPRNLQDAALIDHAIDLAANFPHGAGAPRGPSGDDPGFIDFVKLSFTLFGRNVQSLFLTYFVLLTIEVGLFFAAFRNRAGYLALLTVVAVSHLGLMASGIFDDDIGVGSVSNPRFLSVLAVIPALHAALLVIARTPMSAGQVVMIFLQALLAALAIWVRTSAAWVVIALIFLAITLSIHNLRRPQLGWQTRLIRAWPIAIFLTVVASHAVYVRQTTSMIYEQQGDLAYHPFWHAVLFSMRIHPDFLDRYGSLVGKDWNDEMTEIASRIYLQQHPAVQRPDDYVNGLLTRAAVDRYSRAVVFEIFFDDPVFFVETFIYYKPRLFIKEMLRLPRFSWFWLGASLISGLAWVFVLSRRSDDRQMFFWGSCAILAGFFVSTIPVITTIPFTQVLADQLYLLYITIGAWILFYSSRICALFFN